MEKLTSKTHMTLTVGDNRLNVKPGDVFECDKSRADKLVKRKFARLSTEDEITDFEKKIADLQAKLNSVNSTGSVDNGLTGDSRAAAEKAAAEKAAAEKAAAEKAAAEKAAAEKAAAEKAAAEKAKSSTR